MDAFSGIFTEEFTGEVGDVPTHIEPIQLKRAGGSFLKFREHNNQTKKLGSDGVVSEESPERPHYFVQIREEEITKYLLRDESSDVGQLENSGVKSSGSEGRPSETKEWCINRLEGHLGIAKTCRKLMALAWGRQYAC